MQSTYMDGDPVWAFSCVAYLGGTRLFCDSCFETIKIVSRCNLCFLSCSRSLSLCIDKIPVSASKSSPKVVVSPKGLSDDNSNPMQLRTHNKILVESLQTLHQQAILLVHKHYDLAWFTRNRTRYPNSDARKRIEQEHAGELAKLEQPDGAGDFHHGVHMGVLATSKLFQEQTDKILELLGREKGTNENGPEEPTSSVTRYPHELLATARHLHKTAQEVGVVLVQPNCIPE